MDVVYIAFAKAFDAVCHILLIEKLRLLRIGILLWIGGFFLDLL